MKTEKRKYESKELTPSENNESLPQQIDEVALHRVLVAGSEQCDDPGDDVALRSDDLFFEVVTDFWVEDPQQSFELVHFYLENLKLMGE